MTVNYDSVVNFPQKVILRGSRLTKVFLMGFSTTLNSSPCYKTKQTVLIFYFYLYFFIY